MDEAVARWLVSPDAEAALARAMAEPDPTSVAAAERLRRELTPERAAAVLEQAALRARAATKFGPDAPGLYFTHDGLEQATRPRVAAARARRLAGQARRVIDLGCGIGADARAFAAAGVEVVGVELDPATAVLAEANTGARVVVGDAAAVAGGLLGEGDAVFCDPARRTARGRTWRVEDFTPPWDFVTGLLDGRRPAAVKLGPGLPTELVADGVEAEWVSDRGTVVEACLWAGGDAVPGRRRATVDGAALWRDGAMAAPEVAELGAYLYEPDGAVIRAGLIPAVAERVAAALVAPGVAYLTSSRLVATPFADAFAVREVLPVKEKALRAWVRERGVGVLEIKKRGVDVDPAALRRRLRPQGSASATLIITPTPRGAVTVVAERVPRHPGSEAPGALDGGVAARRGRG
ncbi:THUMP-like domain-containing protein [Nigerium massiliense]|uniref:THUMP-like domain-containing protein n=1 Tax=Nigerium massiliense TaxID=1522317 RepID=UPI0006949F4C|nr:methyltransferase domain-containing protein [Nigerium massiliense]